MRLVGDDPLDRLQPVLDRAQLGAKLGAEPRVLSTLEWDVPSGVLEGFLAVLAAGGSLVQVSNPDAGRLAARRESENVTLQLG